jgi:hypothetical protein
MLVETFKPKGEEVTGAWTKLYNEEHHALYIPPDVIRVMKHILTF